MVGGAVKVLVSVAVEGGREAGRVKVSADIRSSVYDPHADSNMVPPIIKTIIFFTLMIEFPDQTQSIQCQPGSDDINDLRLFGDDFSQPARCDDFHIAS